MKIGQYLKRQDWHDPCVASDRIRGEWVMRYCPEMEEWQPGKKYDAVIFHNSPVRQITPDAAVKIADICDPLWQNDPVGFKRMTGFVKGFVTATEELQRQVKQFTSKPVTTIGDGHHFPFYETRAWNPHAERAKTAVWFGYADNAFALEPLFPAIFSAGIQRLKIISERNPFSVHGIDFVKWELNTFIREISLTDFAILPVTQPYKSNNKDISAMLSGIPVAKTADDIARLVDPVERQRDMTKATEIVSQHCARDRAREYMNWIKFCATVR